MVWAEVATGGGGALRDWGGLGLFTDDGVGGGIVCAGGAAVVFAAMVAGPFSAGQRRAKVDEQIEYCQQNDCTPLWAR